MSPKLGEVRSRTRKTLHREKSGLVGCIFVQQNNSKNGGETTKLYYVLTKYMFLFIDIHNIIESLMSILYSYNEDSLTTFKLNR